MAGRTDIKLTVGVDERIEGIDAVGRRIHDEMAAAGGAAGKDAGERFGSEFTREIYKQNPKITRAYDRVVTTISRTTELEERLAKSRQLTKMTSDEVVSAERDLDRLRQSGTASTKDLTDAQDRLTKARLDDNSAMSRQIDLQSRLTRARNEHRSALNAVAKAQDAIANDGGTQQSILSLGKMISALRSVMIPIGGLGIATIGSQILSAASAATQSLWMIPAAAGAAAAGIGTLSLATVGFGDTVQALAKGDLEKFAELIQKLSPNAQQAALAIQAIWPELTKLKDATQDALFADVAPMLNQLANQYLPVIQQLTTGVASAFNVAGKALFEQLMTPETQSTIQSLVNNLSAAFNNLAPALAPLSQAILDIVNAGAGFLPQIADSAARAAQAFGDFITRASNSGELQRWMQEGLDTMGMLWEGVKALGQAFADLAPSGRESLPGLIEGIKQISAALPPVIELLEKLAPPISGAAESVKVLDSAFNLFYTGTLGGLKTFTDQWGEFGRVIQSIIDKITSLKNLLKFLNPANLIGDIFGSARGLIDRNSVTVVPKGAMPGMVGGGYPIDGDPTTGLLGAGGAGGPSIPTSGGGLLGAAGSAGGMDSTNSGPGILNPGNISTLPTAGIPGYPAGGYPVPAPPPEKGAKASEPPFSADPSLWSVDAIPVEALPNGLASSSGLTPNAAALNDIVSSLFAIPAAGGWRPPDGYNEHSAGEAVDFMTGGDFNLGDSINAFMLQNAKALGLQYTIWKQTQFYPDGRVIPMGDRGNPTANHMDHVHGRVFPGPATAGGIMPGAGAGAAAAGMMGGTRVVDPEAVLRAEYALQTAKNDVEQKRLRLLELEAKGNASQRELLTARNDVTESENKYRLADLNLQQARAGKYKELDGKVSNAANSIGQIGTQLADDFGISEGLPGIAKWITSFLANLAFAPAIGALSAVSAANPIQGGSGLIGMAGAQRIASNGSLFGTPASGMTGLTMPAAPVMPSLSGIGPAPLGGGLGAPVMSATPGLAAPVVPGASNAGPPVTGGGIGGGGLMPGLAPPPAGLTTPQTSMAPSASSPGGGFSGIGGLPLAAIQNATMGLDLLAPGASQAAQVGIQVLNRTAGYIGQLGAIGIGGLLETFLPNNSPIADPSKSWLGKIASGFAGARPALPNTAGSPAPAQQPAPQQAAAGSGGPMVQIENMVNQTADGGQSVANQIARMAMTSHSSGGPR